MHNAFFLFYKEKIQLINNKLSSFNYSSVCYNKNENSMVV